MRRKSQGMTMKLAGGMAHGDKIGGGKEGLGR